MSTNTVFRRLPFYEVLSQLLMPSSLGDRSKFPRCVIRKDILVPMPDFNLINHDLECLMLEHTVIKLQMSSGQEKQLQQYLGKSEIRVHLRICPNDDSGEQDDRFPLEFIVQVNSKTAKLRNSLKNSPKRIDSPVDITDLFNLSSNVTNEISISWTDFMGPYIIGIFIVRRLSPKELLHKIESNNENDTRDLIKRKLADNSVSETIAIDFTESLICPLGKVRIQSPCRSKTCDHIQCFDGLLYLKMNEKRPIWLCPVCGQKALFHNLYIDGEILKKAPIACKRIQFNEDSSWIAIEEEEEDSDYDSDEPHSLKRKNSEQSSDAKIMAKDSSDQTNDSSSPTPMYSTAENIGLYSSNKLTQDLITF